MIAFGSNFFVANGLLQLSHRIAQDPARGRVFVDVYQGTPAGVTAAIALIDPQASWDIDDSNSPMLKLTVVSPDNLDFQTIWEVHGNDLNKSIYELRRTVEDVSVADQKIIKAWFRGAQDAAIPTFANPTASELFRLLYKETNSYFKAQFVLRQRQVGSNQGFPDANLRLNSVGLVFLQHDLMPGGAFDLNLPLAIQDQLNDIEAELPSPTPDNQYTWGWLFKTPSLTGLPGGKFELRQEWYLELWANYLYDLAVP